MNRNDLLDIEDYLKAAAGISKSLDVPIGTVVAMFQVQATCNLAERVGYLVGGTPSDQRTGQKDRNGLLQSGEDIGKKLESLAEAAYVASGATA